MRPWTPEAAPDIRASQDLLVSREGTVTFETNRYSVPAELIGKMVCLRHDPLGRSATIYLNGKELYQLTLLSAGGKGRLVRPQDADGLRARWERENRRLTVTAKPKPMLQTNEPPTAMAAVEVESRHPACYDRLLEGA